jgi:sugar lactone lactonase YvrE
VQETLAGDGINGPWDTTALDLGSTVQLFVTNVLNGTVKANGATVDRGTVLRLTLAVSDDHAPRVVDRDVIGSGFGERSDPAALVVGPTGVGLAANGTLYVADTVGNRIAAIPGAPWREDSDGTGTTVTSNGALNSPLGLAIGHDGSILTVNAGDGNLVATSPAGKQVQTVTLDSSGSPAGAGALFGLAPVGGDNVYFVDDASNTLGLLH